MANELLESTIVLNHSIDLLFDLDEALAISTETPKGSSLQNTASNSTTPLSKLPIVTTAGVCAVCMEDFETGFPGKQVPCGHVFHASCIAKWVTKCSSCPLCRSPCLISCEESLT